MLNKNNNSNKENNKKLTSLRNKILNLCTKNPSSILMAYYYTSWILLTSSLFLPYLLHVFILPKLMQIFIKCSNFDVCFLAISDAKEESMDVQTQFSIKAWVPIKCFISFQEDVTFGFLKSNDEDSSKTDNNDNNQRIRYFGKGKLEDIKLNPSKENTVGTKTKIKILNKKMLAKFAKQAIEQKENYLVLKGFVALKVFGIKVIRNVKFNKTTKIKAMHGLKNIQISNITIEEGTDKHVKIFVDTKIYNPSIMEISVGTVKLNMYYENELMGIVIINDMKLEMGNNYMSKCETYYMPSPQNPNALLCSRKFLSNFCNGIKSRVVIKGDREDCAYPDYWSEAFEALNVEVIMPGMEKGLIENATIGVTRTIPILITSFATTIKCNVTINNPFNERISIKSISGKARINKVEAGEIDCEFSEINQNNTIGPRETKKVCGIEMKLRKSTFKALYENNVFEEIYSDISSTLSFYLGKYSAIVDYNQKHVLTKPEL